MDLLHPVRGRVRSKWSLHGVRLLSLPRGATKKANFNRWAHEICTEDNEERALVVGSMNEMAYVFQAWLPLVVWQQVDGPQYRKGFITVTIMSVILIISTMATRSMQHRDDRRR